MVGVQVDPHGPPDYFILTSVLLSSNLVVLAKEFTTEKVSPANKAGGVKYFIEFSVQRNEV